MNRRLAVLTFLLVASSADAQIIRRPVRSLGPSSWLGLSAGLTQQWSLRDGSTNSTWNFGSATEYRVSYEKALQTGGSFGAAIGYAQVPLSYQGGDILSVRSCPTACDATATVTQLLAIFHAGDGIGFHQAFEATGGATGYSGFRAQSDNARLAPTKLDVDMAFSLGYGVAYGLSPTSSVELLEELNLGIHQRAGLTASDNNYPRSSATRLSVRIGLGSR